MISKERTNLLEATAEALVNAVNTAGVMGKGIALQFKQAYPANFRAYDAQVRDAAIREAGEIVRAAHQAIAGE